MRGAEEDGLEQIDDVNDGSEQIDGELVSKSGPINNVLGDGSGPINGLTGGVDTLLGDPKKAILKLAIPMILAMSVQTIYNLVDAFWVAGLGTDALSAVGFFFPFFFMVIAIATGLGVGGSAAISRRIGAKDKEGADSVAVHTVVLMLIVTVILCVPLFILSEKIFMLMGAGDVTTMATSYSRVIFAGGLFIFFSSVANAVLRGEGDAKRAMYAMMLGGVLNIILDPIFIYTLDLGVSGAALATVISLMVTSMVMAYWLFIKKDTFVSFKFKGFKFRWDSIKDILVVGVPGSIMQLSMSITMLALNGILVGVGGTDAVAVYSTGWRVATLGVLPIMGIATAVVSVTGASYGAKNPEKLQMAYHYALKLGTGFGIITAVLLFIFAPQIASVFTRAEGADVIKDDLVLFFRIMSAFFVSVPYGMLSSATFQGTGKGFFALTVTILRTLVFTILLSLLFVHALDMGTTGVWLGLTLGNMIGGAIAFSWVQFYISGMMKKGIP